jgi:hypothetical protein
MAGTERSVISVTISTGIRLYPFVDVVEWAIGFAIADIVISF